MTTLDDAWAVIHDHMNRGAKARRLLCDVARMRAAQRDYFQDRSKAKLAVAKEAEAAVDAGLEELRRK
jgi:hypothetical protein